MMTPTRIMKGTSANTAPTINIFTSSKRENKSVILGSYTDKRDNEYIVKCTEDAKSAQV